MNRDLVLHEIKLSAVRSSGSGGQHVNKTASKIKLEFNVEQSKALTEDEKAKIKESLANRLTTVGSLVMSCGRTRSQYRNKEIVIRRLITLLETCLKSKKLRKRTKIPRVVKIKRLEQKRLHAQKKAARKKPKIE